MLQCVTVCCEACFRVPLHRRASLLSTTYTECGAVLCSVLYWIAEHTVMFPSAGEHHCHRWRIQSLLLYVAVCCEACCRVHLPPESFDVIDDEYSVWCSVLQCSVVRYSVLQRVAKHAVFVSRELYCYTRQIESVLLCAIVCCSVLQRVAVCCNVWQRVVSSVRERRWYWRHDVSSHGNLLSSSSVPW